MTKEAPVTYVEASEARYTASGPIFVRFTGPPHRDALTDLGDDLGDFARPLAVRVRHEKAWTDRMEGRGVFAIPYGPVRSGVFESAQFLVQTAGEDILTMTPRMFYKHRGIEKLFADVPLDQTVLVAEHASGVAALAHSLAFCHGARAGARGPPAGRVHSHHLRRARASAQPPRLPDAPVRDGLAQRGTGAVCHAEGA